MANEPEQIMFYAIRLKGTNKYLPMLERQYGHSFAEPVSIDEKPPRLFFTERSAKAALSSWLLGHHKKTRCGYNSSYYDDDGGYEEWIDIIPQPNRQRDKMEIAIFYASEKGVLEVQPKRK